MQSVGYTCQAGPLAWLARPLRPSANPARCSRRSTLVRASPCVLITAPDGITNPSLQQLAFEVRQQLGMDAVVLAPAAATHKSSSQHAPSHHQHQAAAQSTPAASLTFEQELQLQPCPDGDLTYSLAGDIQPATAADCVLCAVDQTHGLLQALDLSPVLVLVGVSRGPALSSDMPLAPAVAVAQQAALLGLPAVAACLATTSASAPMQPAVAATVQLLAKLLPVLQHTSGSSRGSGGSLTSARNFPRAHFPFPEEGRWALGTQMPLPHSPSAKEAGSSSGWQKYDSWALGDDNSWLGEYSSSSSRSRSGRRGSGGAEDPAVAQQQAYRTLRGAFADGDLLLCLNVPPTWQEAAGFAATRPGVLWHCWQVEAQGMQQQQQQQQWSGSSSSGGHWSGSGGSTAGDGGTEAAAPAAAVGGRWSHLYANATDSSSSSSSNSSSRSWDVDRQDLFGRTLPSTSYGSHVPAGSNFVGQDNTRKVLAESRGTSSSPGFPSTAAAGAAREATHDWGRSQQHQQQQKQVPASFTVKRGTLLNDAAACGDVEAVFSGRAAVTVCQTWPAGHPLSCRDELLLAALDEGPAGGLPAWLRME